MIKDLYGHTTSMPFREAPDKFRSSRLRGQIHAGDEPTDVFYPLKALPIAFLDVETQDPVVIAKGTIVSAWGHFTENTHIPVPASSGTIPVYEAVGNGTMNVNIDTSFWGYPNAVAALLVPANGGSVVTLDYSQYDIDFGTYDIEGNKVTASTSGLVVPANIPIGIVAQDVYSDFRGKYLNYYSPYNKPIGILRKAYINIPFVATDKFDEAYSATFTDDTIYGNLWKVYAFIYDDSTDLTPGAFVKSDTHGKFIVESDNVSANRTIQTVGRIYTVDSRFPKGLLEYVDTYPGSMVTGTDTGGLPDMLFVFAHQAIYYATGSTPSIQDVVNAVKAGIFGIANIQVDI